VDVIFGTQLRFFQPRRLLKGPGQVLRRSLDGMSHRDVVLGMVCYNMRAFIHELRDVLIATVAVALFFGVAILIALAFSGHLWI
jgi:uncharacterized membrane protein